MIDLSSALVLQSFKTRSMHKVLKNIMIGLIEAGVHQMGASDYVSGIFKDFKY